MKAEGYLIHFDVTAHRKPLIFFITKIVIFDRGLSQGVSKIGTTHQITLSTNLGEYRENHAEISWPLTFKGRRSLQSRLSAS